MNAMVGAMILGLIGLVALVLVLVVVVYLAGFVEWRRREERWKEMKRWNR